VYLLPILSVKVIFLQNTAEILLVVRMEIVLMIKVTCVIKQLLVYTSRGNKTANI